MWPWSTKPDLSSTGIFVAIAKNTLYGSKLSIFLNLDNFKGDFLNILNFLHTEIPDV